MSTGGDDELSIKMDIDNAEAIAKIEAEAKAFDHVAAEADQASKVVKKNAEAEAAALGKVASKADATAKAVGGSARKSSADRVKAAGKAADAEVASFDRSRDALGRFTGQGSKGLGGLGSAAEGLVGTFRKITSAAAGLGVVKGAFDQIIGAMRTANEEGQKNVDHLLSLKNMVRDIASMTGSAGGSSDAFVQKFLDIRKASGLDEAGAHAFVQEFAGAGEAKKGVNISPEEYEKAKPLVARFAAASSGGDAQAAGAYGQLAGLMLGYDKDQTSGGFLAKLTGVKNILDLGVGDNPTLIREFSQQAGALLNAEGTGYGGDPNKLGALIATSSIQRSAGQSGTVVQQASKVLRGFTEKQGGMLASAGITPKDDMIDALHKLFDKIQAAEAKGIAPDQFLAAGGVEADEDRKSLAALYAGRAYMDRFIEMGARPPTEAEARAQLEAKFRAESGLQANVAQAKLDEAKARTAMQEQHVKPLQLEAEAALEARGEGAGSATAAAEDATKGNLASAFGLFAGGMSPKELGRAMRVEQEMFKRATAKGLKVPDRPDPVSPLGGVSGDYMGFITSGNYKHSYAAATNTGYLQDQVGGSAGPTVAGRAMAQGNDANWEKVVGGLRDLKGATDAQTKAIVGATASQTRTLAGKLGGGGGLPVNRPRGEMGR